MASIGIRPLKRKKFASKVLPQHVAGFLSMGRKVGMALEKKVVFNFKRANFPSSLLFFLLVSFFLKSWKFQITWWDFCWMQVFTLKLYQHRPQIAKTNFCVIKVPRPLLQSWSSPSPPTKAHCNGTLQRHHVHSANGTTSTPPKLVVTLPPTITHYNGTTLQWHPAMAPSNGTTSTQPKLVVTLPPTIAHYNGTLQRHPAMAPRPLHPAMAPSNGTTSTAPSTGTTSTAPCNGILATSNAQKLFVALPLYWK